MFVYTASIQILQVIISPYKIDKSFYICDHEPQQICIHVTYHSCDHVTRDLWLCDTTDGHVTQQSGTCLVEEEEAALVNRSNAVLAH